MEILIASLGVKIVVGICIFGAIAAIVWITADMISGKGKSVEDRLDSLSSPW